MDNLLRLIFALLIVFTALGIRGLARYLRLPSPPFGIVIFAAIAWFVFRSIGFTGGARHYNAFDEIVLSYAAISYLLWFIVEIPPRYGFSSPFQTS